MSLKDCDPYIKQFGNAYKCLLCNIVLNSLQQAQNHGMGKSHKKLLRNNPLQYNKISSVPSTVQLKDKPAYTFTFHNNEIENADVKVFDTVCDEPVSVNIPEISPKMSLKDCDPYIKQFGNAYKCLLCNIVLNSLQQAQNHGMGKSHNKLLRNNPLQYNKISSVPSTVQLKDEPAYTFTYHNKEIENADVKVFDTVCDEPMSVNIPEISPKMSLKDCDPYIKQYGNSYKCLLCNIVLNSLEQAQNHGMGKSHNKLLRNNPLQYNEKISSVPSVAQLKDEPAYTFTFHNIKIENVTADVKVFDIDEPVCF